MSANNLVRVLTILALFWLAHIAKTSTDAAIFITGAFMLIARPSKEPKL